ncbi:MAG: hypothetical protein LPJ92_05065 [Rhodobacterales bacterium]|nr:hypothetical protein [Rhodobacterales bacterium]MDX5389684.1 hypothetical protein [Rhodobacterales bacterium]MDX5489381.1 hypothetical protein [Rhodobacterales bacterium]
MKSPRKNRLPARVGRGSLATIGILLVGSALIRAGIGATEAMATGNDPTQTEAVVACEPPAEMAALIAEFQNREQRLNMREEQINARMQALVLADREIEQKLTSLAESEESLRATLSLAATAAEDDISRLVTVYEAMKPKEAAILFEEMSPEFAAGFLGRMRPEAAAGILAGLTPQSAYSLSVILAGRNASAPRE